MEGKPAAPKRKITKKQKAKPEEETLDLSLSEDVNPSVIAYLHANLPPGWTDSTPEEDEAHALYLANQVVLYKKRFGRLPTTGVLGKFLSDMRAQVSEERRE